MHTWAVRSIWLSALAVILAAAPAFAQPSLSGTGTAVIDGMMSPGEWDGAGSVSLMVNVPAYDVAGAMTPATLYVMNDSTNLYIGVRITRTGLGGSTNVGMEFDNDNDGLREVGDDALVANLGVFQPTVLFADDFRTTCPGDPAGTTGCGPADVEDGGARDGSAGIANDGTYTFVEIEHPLDSTDNLHDFSLSAGQIVGFQMMVRLFALDTACNDPANPACYADTYFPILADPAQWGDIRITASTPRECLRACAVAGDATFQACRDAGGRPLQCALMGLRFLGECFRSCRP